jgi:hypothetical protein
MLLFKDAIIEDTLGRIRSVYTEHYHESVPKIVEKVFADTVDLFNGKIKGFQRCDIGYHDISHTMQTVYPFADIITGWNTRGGHPVIPRYFFDMGLMAVLLHDTGYIKTEDDLEGTGAKYTFKHIQRSIDFARQYLSLLGLELEKIYSVQNAIRCTGVLFRIDEIDFNSYEEQIIGFALGTADLLGQMAESGYVKKLFILYKEFEEAYSFEGRERLQKEGVQIFGNVEELMKNTKRFYEYFVIDRFERMRSVYKYIPGGNNQDKNPYIKAIENNIMELDRYLLSKEE